MLVLRIYNAYTSSTTVYPPSMLILHVQQYNGATVMTYAHAYMEVH